MRVGVVGVGVVGGAVAKGMEFVGHSVRTHDTKFEGSGIENVIDTDLCFVCVPTPTVGDVQDKSIVKKVVYDLYNLYYSGVIVIKSTVLPGTTSRLIQSYSEADRPPRIAFSPEFLRERAASIDFLTQELCIVGTDNAADFEVVRKAHELIAKRVVQAPPGVAESVKYFLNVYNALRVVMANSFYEVFEAEGISYEAVKALAVQTGIVSGMYLDCNPRMRGFGGVCLPKDSAAFADWAKYVAPNLRLFETIVAENKKFPTTVFPGMRA